MITTDSVTQIDCPFKEDLLAMRCPLEMGAARLYFASVNLSILSICGFTQILKGMNGAILAYGQTASGSGLRRVPA